MALVLVVVAGAGAYAWYKYRGPYDNDEGVLSAPTIEAAHSDANIPCENPGNIELKTSISQCHGNILSVPPQASIPILPLYVGQRVQVPIPIPPLYVGQRVRVTLNGMEANMIDWTGNPGEEWFSRMEFLSNRLPLIEGLEVTIIEIGPKFAKVRTDTEGSREQWAPISVLTPIPLSEIIGPWFLICLFAVLFFGFIALLIWFFIQFINLQVITYSASYNHTCDVPLKTLALLYLVGYGMLCIPYRQPRRITSLQTEEIAEENKFLAGVLFWNCIYFTCVGMWGLSILASSSTCSETAPELFKAAEVYTKLSFSCNVIFLMSPLLIVLVILILGKFGCSNH
jgi:hypothetical protein